MRAAASRHQFTVEEFHHMGAAGILHHSDRVELIDGQIIQMAAIGSRHAACVGRLTRLVLPLAEELIVWVQNPVRLDRYTELVPDVALLRPREDFYAEAHPGPEDVLLLIEVADATLDYDRRTKIPAYGRAGVPEVWLVDLPNRLIEVFHDPSPESGYTHSTGFPEGGAVESLSVPGLSVPVDDVLG